MPIGAMIFLGSVLLLFTVLDMIMLVSLLRPGDERSQLIVWKAAAITLVSIVGSCILDVAENFLRSQSMTINPLILLETTVIVYFAALLFFRKRLGG